MADPNPPVTPEPTPDSTTGNGDSPFAPDAKKTSGGSRVWMVLRYAVALALLGYLFSSGSIQWEALSNLFSQWWVTAGALLMLGCVVVTTSWRFCLLLRPRALDITLAASIRLTMIGMFFNTVLPGAGGGDFVRFYYGVRGHEGRRTEILTVMFFDRLAGLFAMISWPLIAAPFFVSMWIESRVLTGLLGAGLTAALGMIAVFLVAWSPLASPGGTMETLVKKVPAGDSIWTVMETIASYRHHKGTVLVAVGVSLLSHTLGIGAALVLASVTVPDSFSWAMSVLIPLGFMANTVPLTPGGLGVGEAAFDSLFGLAGLDGGAEVLLGWRLLILVMGLAGLGVYLHGRHDFVRSGDSE